MSDKFNGWTNFETWQANLWLSNTEWVWDDMLAIHETGRAVDAEDVERILVAMVGQQNASLLSDITTAWLACVNYQEIADGFNEGTDYE